jgi:hypothetical protein
MGGQFYKELSCKRCGYFQQKFCGGTVEIRAASVPNRE